MLPTTTNANEGCFQVGTVTWQVESGGDLEGIATGENPGLVQLTANGPDFARFNADVDSAVGPLTASIRTSDYFAFYVDVSTSRGRREFKMVATDTGGPRLRFGYRYDVFLGRALRDGRLQLLELDLAAIANEVEANTTIQSIDSVYLRTEGQVQIELVDASVDVEPPDPDPDPDPPTTGDITAVEAARFLTQATYGPTLSAIDELQALGSYEAWIDRQFQAPVSLTLPYVRANSNGSLRSTRHHIWFDNAINGEDQLRQRVAFAWSELFVISDRDYVLSNSQYSISQYYDLLAQLGLGNFRTLLETVTLHPTMGVFLSMIGNEKADPSRNVRPDENFAREVLQLFTIGLHELDASGVVRNQGGQPIPTYDQTTIEEFARVFTGWNYDGQRTWNETNAGFQNRESPMVPYEEFHDTGSKRLLNGTVLPAGQSARADLNAALDNIFAHPNVGPFVSRHLIQRLVTSNPTPQYIGRVAAVFNNDGTGERGNLAAVVRAILLDSEARTGHIIQETAFGKLREPVLRLTHLFRAFEAEPGPTSNGVYVPEGKTIDRIDEILGQSVLQSRSVFNFFPPDYPLTPDSALFAPELSILSEINVASTNNLLFNQIFEFHNRSNATGTVSRLQVEREVGLASNPEALVAHLDLLLTSGSIPDDARVAIVNHLGTIPDNPDGHFVRALDAMFLVAASPFHSVQK